MRHAQQIDFTPWKYVNVRRDFVYLAHSLDGGTRWAVFEPNGRLRP